MLVPVLPGVPIKALADELLAFAVNPQ